MDRFEFISRQRIMTGEKVEKHGNLIDESLGQAIVLRDKQTGVLYLWCKDGRYQQSSAGLTVMLDQDGKPVTTNYSVKI